jgi:hypothetical protein
VSLNPKTYINDLRTPSLHARLQSRLWVLETINLGFEATATMSLAALREPDLSDLRAVLTAAPERAEALILRR